MWMTLYPIAFGYTPPPSLGQRINKLDEIVEPVPKMSWCNVEGDSFEYINS